MTGGLQSFGSCCVLQIVFIGQAAFYSFKTNCKKKTNSLHFFFHIPNWDVHTLSFVSLKKKSNTYNGIIR